MPTPTPFYGQRLRHVSGKAVHQHNPIVDYLVLLVGYLIEVCNDLSKGLQEQQNSGLWLQMHEMSKAQKGTSKQGMLCCCPRGDHLKRKLCHWTHKQVNVGSLQLDLARLRWLVWASSGNMRKTRDDLFAKTF